MRTATVAGILVLLVALLGAAAFGLGLVGDSGTDLALSTKWVSDTGRDVNANHHAPAVGIVDGESMVFAPVSGRRNTTQCGLYALHANGSREWTYQVSPGNCTIHSVADATAADFDADGDLEVLTATTEQTVVALDARTGDVELKYALSSYGYTRPIVADLVGDNTPETIVVDAYGTVSVIRPDGTTVWSTALETYTWGQPAVADFDGDGAPELAVGVGGDGALHVFEANGTPVWERTSGISGGVTWMTTGQADADTPVEIVVGTPAGGVQVVDGATGDTQWERDFGRFAAVHAFGDGDGDGAPELYVTARDGVLRALDAGTGETEWTTQLTTERVQMMPPPTFGDVDGDGTQELVAVSNDGTVSVVDPGTGDIRARYERENPIFTNAVTADIDADDADEIIVMYGDGRVVVLDADV